MQKISYQCTRCTFKFSRKEKPPTCPYCDKNNTLVEMGTSPAQDIIQQSEF